MAKVCIFKKKNTIFAAYKFEKYETTNRMRSKYF